jgi:hypothetical protein
MLARLLRDEPTEDVIEAVSAVADEDCIVQLGRALVQTVCAPIFGASNRLKAV